MRVWCTGCEKDEWCTKDVIFFVFWVLMLVYTYISGSTHGG